MNTQQPVTKNKSELNEYIRYAKKQIAEWTKCLKDCEKKLKKLTK